MKVNGEAFRRAREEIRKDSPKRGAPGKPAKGTQEWLASVARVPNEKAGNGEPKWRSLSVRTIQALEKGVSSIETVDAVSPHLEINGRELIFGYGKESVICRATGVIDFRPSDYPVDNNDDFFKSPLLVTVDPLELSFDPIDIDQFHVEGVELNLSFDEFNQKFTWLYEVSFTKDTIGWLGVVKELRPFLIDVGNGRKTINMPIMFSSLSASAISWKDFVDKVEKSTDTKIMIDINIFFSNFEKNIKLICSIDLLKENFKIGREKRKSTYPYKTHVRSICIDN